MLNKRPNSKWEVKLMTNLIATVYPLNFVIGYGVLPDCIKHSNSIIGLDINQNDDNLCIFRCIAYHSYGPSFGEAQVKQMAKQWMNMWCAPDEEFHGIDFHELPNLEELFKINLHVYSLMETGEAAMIYRSINNHKDTLYLNLYDNHFSVIIKLDAYCKKYRCTYCSQLSSSACNLQKHQARCTARTKFRFPGGYFTPPTTLFDEAESIGILVPQKDRFYPFQIAFNMEAQFAQNGNGNDYGAITEHHPISVAVCSNVPDYTEPYCIVEPDSDMLVQKMAEYMTTLAERAEVILRHKWKVIFDHIDELLELWKIKDDKHDNNDDDEEQEEDIEDDAFLCDLIEREREEDVYGDYFEPHGLHIAAHFMPDNIESLRDDVKRKMRRRIKWFQRKLELFV